MAGRSAWPRKAQLGILCRQYSLSITSTNVCGACHPEDDFFEIVSETIKPLKSEYPYEISVYNTFRVEERKHFQKTITGA